MNSIYDKLKFDYVKIINGMGNIPMQVLCVDFVTPEHYFKSVDKVVKGIGRTFLVKKFNIYIHFFTHVTLTCDVKIHK